MTRLEVSDGPKMLRETLCAAQAAVADRRGSRAAHHVAQLGRLIDECDRLRPLGPDGKHGDRHTRHCGCAVTRRQRLALLLRRRPR